VSAHPIEVVGHGGAGHFFPGNSRSSVQKAVDLGVDRIEIDLVAAAGGELLLVHDRILKDEAGKKLKVRLLPVERVRELVDELLTLEEFFELIGPTFPVLLDLKQPGYEAAVADAIGRQPGRDVWISTSHARSIFWLQRRLPKIRTGLSTGHVASGFPNSRFEPIVVRVVRAITPFPLLIAAKLCGATMIMVNFRAGSPWLVRVAQAGGLPVAVWTVNRPADIQRMAAMNVDAIISNRPDLVREIVQD